ncbi:hypothetical protein PoB_003392500 [Plakobranchus ocellatus]|uniref:Uncharacterized protein n=1 Tax=Plakobranchus ocellatus TaxID=259542 RepID=A0AAV4AGW0_9GAST|nr:hypothetical protein PoB_003392500 [Plakobranchus ocellatus]
MASQSRIDCAPSFARHLVSLILILVVAGCVAPSTAQDTVAATPSYVAAVFHTPMQNGSLLHMAVNIQTQVIYIGAVDYIYRLVQGSSLTVNVCKILYIYTNGSRSGAENEYKG